MTEFETHISEIQACRLCEDRFKATATGHAPRPVAWLSQTARVLIIGQAPGARVHESGRPFTDPSGERLRGWMGVDDTVFYDQSKLSIFPMAFCFPGYNDKGSDLPPPKLCATTWRSKTLALMPQVELTLLIGGYAQTWHLKTRNVTNTVRNWRDFGPAVIPLPHPSWRNTGWIKKNPWFETDLLPYLRERIAELI